ncbi:MAG: RagB/SusD family nutrient uptake outer membrane protein [Prolixibacteraceae bacterium]
MKKIFSILVITFILAGCSDEFLNRSSLTSLADDTFWTTESDALLALSGCYSKLQDPYLFDSDPWAGGVVRMDYMSDDGWCRWGWMAGGALSRGEHSTTDGMVSNLWKRCYETIVRCNRVIETVPTLNQSIIETAKAKQIIAEAKFIRALMYNMLTMTFRDVPLITKLQNVQDAMVPKNTKAEIVKFILDDLKASVEDLPAPGSVDWGRATKGAGYALIARISLYNMNWSEAALWSKKVIDLGKYSLYPDFGKLFQSANEINNEVIFPVRFLRGPDEDGANFAGYWGVGVINYQEVLPNLAEEYYCSDGKPITVSSLYNSKKPSADRDPRFDASIVSKGSLWRGTALDTYTKTWTGFAQRKYTEEGNSENHFDADEDFYIFRLGEVLLMRAEALAESNGDKNEIFALINQLRNRNSVKMPLADQAELDTYYAGKIVDLVRHERRVETAFEGLRYFDLIRWGKLKERAIDFYMSSEKSRLSKISDRKWVEPNSSVWPIPQSELDINKMLGQNAEWN